MARFLNTSATNYFLEELIKSARERLVIISPFLKFNPRMKELLEDKNRMKIDVRVVYGKNELPPGEITWLQSLNFVRTSFCQNLHAKCYLNEETAIITSMNLYEFSQVNNNEMGVLIERNVEPELFKDTYEEAQRLIRVSDEIRLSVQKVGRPANGDVEPKPETPRTPARHAPEAQSKPAPASNASKANRKDAGTPSSKDGDGKSYDKLTSSRLAKQHELKTAEFIAHLVRKGLLVKKDDGHELTEAGKRAGGEPRVSKQYGSYFLWPKGLDV